MMHTCHARGCEIGVPPRMLMCPHHWARVPMPLKRLVYEHYQPGQERTKRPSPEWLRAARMSINAVAAQDAAGGAEC